MSDINWLGEPLVLELHAHVIEHSGGTHGVLNPGMLESALNRALQRANYDDTADLADLAAAYGFGLIKNHAFLDGNKRTGMLCVEAFLFRNGYALAILDDEGVEIAVKVARDDIDEAALAAWIRTRSQPL